MDTAQRKYDAKKLALKTAIADAEKLLAEVNPNSKALQGQLPRLARCQERFLVSSDSLEEEILKTGDSKDDDDDEEEEDSLVAHEVEQSELFANSEEVMREIEDILRKSKPQDQPKEDDVGSTTSNQGSRGNHHRLPKLELPKFGGEAREWLQFWSGFQTIHDDDTITSQVKFQCLLNCMVHGSPAEEVVRSFPVSELNYAEVIKTLDERFGRDDMLVEVYIRDLITLILENAQKTTSFSSLFVRLSSQLRALNTLGVTTDKCAAILYPMVESTLPEDIFVAWERYRIQNNKGGKQTSEQHLNTLMEFLKHEVEGTERIRLARQPFSTTAAVIVKTTERKMKTFPATAATLINSEAKSIPACVFCEGKHSSEVCCKAVSMSLEERKKLVQEKRRCFICLKPYHNAKKCRATVKCVSCGRKHWAILCPDLNKKTDTETKEDHSKLEFKDREKLSSSMFNQVKSHDVLMSTVVLKINGKKKSKIVRAMFDSGSQKSYVLQRTAEEVGLQKVDNERIIHMLFGGLEETKYHNRCPISLSNVENGFQCSFVVSDIEKITGKIANATQGEWIEELKKKGIILSDHPSYQSREIEILFGADVCGRLHTGRKIDLEAGPTVAETKFGWTISGMQSPDGYHESDTPVFSGLSLIKDLSIQDLWSLDVIGIHDPVKDKSKTELEEAAMDHFNSTVTRTNEGRYVIHLPWIQGHPPIPSYKMIAENKLRSTTARLQKQGVLTAYHEVFKSWEEDGVIERVDTGSGHFLSHHGVLKPESLTTPVRPVFNASFKTKGNPSLNDCLEIGPNLLEEIPAILIRFRLGSVGMISDIKKAFLQVEVTEKDRDFLRFLWYKDDNLKELQIFRHCRVVFGVSSSPFLLAAVLKYHLSQETDQKFAETLSKSFYVDNSVASFSTVEEAMLFKEKASSTLLNAQMDLRGWEWSSAAEEKNVPLLGLMWNTFQDTLVCDVRSTLKKLDSSPTTRRKILAVAHSLFDPIGFICPMTIVPKMILQETCKLKVGWDTELPGNIHKRFTSWSNQIQDVPRILIPRYVASGQTSSWSLHIFTDASSAAYATCAYLRSGTEDKIEVKLLMAKSRVAPLKDVSIPRLELIGCLCGARLVDSIKKMIEFPKIPVTLWTDSTTALAWITGSSNWSAFVSNRVKEINQLTQDSEWRHVPGKDNPADIPSRGATVKSLLESQIWLHGPSWLKEDRSSWPSRNEQGNIDEVNQELRKTVVSHVNVETQDLLSSLNKHSDNHKIVRVVVYIRRFLAVFVHKNGTPKTDVPNFEVGIIPYDEFSIAEDKLLHLIQKVNFHGPQDSKLGNLRVFEDKDGLLKLKTKLFPGGEMEYSIPIILPGKDAVVKKLIWKSHVISCHAGVQFLQTKLREKYWILNSRRCIRSTIRPCATCRRFRSQPIQVEEGPLPADRVRVGAAFDVTGVDMAGPMITKGNKKVWICIFTCAVTRGVHLELCGSLNTETFIGAMRRFVARRGRPSTIYSDNGLNFVGASNLLKAVDWSKILEFSNVSKIKWKFNPPTASWWGGFWERMIGIVKQLLRAVLGSSRVTSEELQTLLCDVEAVVNDRPLTYVSEDGGELVPLTPNMMIRDCGTSVLPDVDYAEREILTSHYKNLQSCRDELRNRFRKEYLAMLIHRGKAKKSREVKVGEVVLVGNDQHKRLHWPMGIIMEVTPGQDGITRLVRVKTANTVLTRPVQRLYPLEINSGSN